jgi:hypothetical protein
MREVMVLIVGDYLHSYTNIKFDTVENLDKLIDEALDELSIGCVSVEIEEKEIFTQEEIIFLQEKHIEIY